MNYLIEFSPYALFPFFSPLGELETGELVIVRDKIGEDIGRVVSQTENEVVGIILRRVDESDSPRLEELKDLGEKALTVFRSIKSQRRLPIKILDYHIRWDKKRMTFYIASWQSFDWEEIEAILEKEIPIKVRIREISPRIFAGVIKGMGRCGRGVCCGLFKENLPRVSMRTARLQGLFIPSERISGICGRLLCCLAYEEEIYEEALAKYPALGSVVKTKRGEGKVAGIDIFHEKILIKLEDREITLPLSELKGR
uniref:PSP1 C-terminal domain-containing protein n=1 Tax=candidate division WOR-3 bacterium TaxID=2052148 RepID=A0A7C3Z2H9_UNCW3